MKYSVNKIRTFKELFLLFLVLIFVLFLQSCFKEVVKTNQPLPDIIWPDPPEVPRIRFVNSISRPGDLNVTKNIFEKIKFFITGEKNRFLSIVNPYGIAKDSKDNLYIVDNFNRIVHVIDEKNNKYFTFPDKEISLLSPIGITIDRNDIIYISDSKEAVVKMFKEQGRKYSGELGRGLLERPTGLAFNVKTDELLVVDTKLSEIVRYDIENHRVKGIIGKEGNIKGLFYNPTNIVTNREGHIIVSDSLNFRIQMLTHDGEFINAFGRAGDSPGYFSRPKGVAVDSDGNIYVVDAIFDNIQIFDKQGRLLMDFGGPGSGYGEFWLPSGIFIDSNDRIYVSDSYNHRVQVFQYMNGEEFIE